VQRLVDLGTDTSLQKIEVLCGRRRESRHNFDEGCLVVPDKRFPAIKGVVAPLVITVEVRQRVSPQIPLLFRWIILRYQEAEPCQSPIAEWAENPSALLIGGVKTTNERLGGMRDVEQVSNLRFVANNLPD
jgi:hypothetical protein